MDYRSLLFVLLLWAPILACAQDVTGSYTFQVKEADTSGAHLIAAGTLVLMDDSVPTNEIPADLLEEVRQDSRWLLREATPDACFGFERSVEEVDGREFYGGIIPAGLSSWDFRVDSVMVKLYQSPDAWMILRGRYEDGRITGVVRQREFYQGEIADRLPFEAERTGPASSDACRAA